MFLMGAMAGFGVALLVFFAHLLEPFWPRLHPGSITAFQAGLALIAVGLVGGLVMARGARGLQLRTSLGAIAIVAVLLGVALDVRRRSKEYWGLNLQHRAQAAGLNARVQLARFDPRVSRQEAASLSMRYQWHYRMAERFERASSAPWLPIDRAPPMPK